MGNKKKLVLYKCCEGQTPRLKVSVSKMKVPRDVRNSKGP